MQYFCDGEKFLICGEAKLSFEFRIACGIYVHAKRLDARDEIFLRNSALLSKPFYIRAHDVGVAVLFSSRLHNCIIEYFVIDIIPYQNYITYKLCDFCPFISVL